MPNTIRDSVDGVMHECSVHNASEDLTPAEPSMPAKETDQALHEISCPQPPCKHLIGDKRSIETIIDEKYRKIDRTFADLLMVPVIIARLADLQQTFTHYRTFKADGNCGLRAISFAYCEVLLRLGDNFQIDKEAARMTLLKNLILAGGGVETSVCEDISENTIRLLKDLANITGPTARSPQPNTHFLIQQLNNPNLSDAILFHFRLLASSWLQRFPEKYIGLLPKGLGTEQYRKNCLEARNQEIDRLGMTILIDMLLKPPGIFTEITYLVQPEEADVMIDTFQMEDGSVIPPYSEKPTVYLLYRPNRYDILYKDIEIQNLSDHIEVRHVSRLEGFSTFTSTFPSFTSFYNLDLSTLACIPGFSRATPSKPSHDPPLQHYALKSYPVQCNPGDIPSSEPGTSSTRDSPSFCPSRYERENVFSDSQRTPAVFQTSTSEIRDSHTPHYNNPNLQPNPWSPDCDDGPSLSGQISLVSSFTADFKPTQLPGEAGPIDSGLCRTSDSMVRIAPPLVPAAADMNVWQTSENFVAPTRSGLSGGKSSLQSTSSSLGKSAISPQTPSSQSEDDPEETDWDKSDTDDYDCSTNPFLTRIALVEDIVDIVEPMFAPMKHTLLQSLVSEFERILQEHSVKNTSGKSHNSTSANKFGNRSSFLEPVPLLALLAKVLKFGNGITHENYGDLMETITSSLSSGVMFSNVHFRQCTGTASTGSFSDSAPALESGTGGYTSKTRCPTNQKRSPLDEDEDQSDNPERRGPKRPRGVSSSPGNLDNVPKFACPYRKHNPRTYCIGSWRSCALTPLKTVARVKAHLYRYHKVSQCQRCKVVFETQEKLDAHIESVEGCEFRAAISVEGVTTRIEKRLQSRKKSYPGQTEEERWKEIYQILFPAEVIPDPYTASYFEPIQDDVGKILEGRSLSDYQDYTLQVLPRMFRSALDAAIDTEFQQIGERMKGRLIVIIQTCQEQLLADFISQHASPPVQDLQGQIPIYSNPPNSYSPTSFPDIKIVSTSVTDDVPEISHSQNQFTLQSYDSSSAGPKSKGHESESPLQLPQSGSGVPESASKIIPTSCIPPPKSISTIELVNGNSSDVSSLDHTTEALFHDPRPDSIDNWWPTDVNVDLCNNAWEIPWN